jgi:hypothetical protein
MPLPFVGAGAGARSAAEAIDGKATDDNADVTRAAVSETKSVRLFMKAPATGRASRARFDMLQ